MRTKLLQTSVLAFGIVSCGGSVVDFSGGAGNAGNPEASLGGINAIGGSSSGNAGSTATGGAATGGKSAAGGAATGDVATGATATGGAATGGAATANTTTSDPCSTTNALSGGTKHCSQSDSGSYGSYEWQLWSNDTAGCLATYDNQGAAFSANWDNSGDFLARVGLIFDGTKTYQELGTFSADFAETHTGTAGGYSYIGIYGWTATPSIDFYIVEDAFDNSPPIQPGGSSNLGTIQVDGGTYDVYFYQTPLRIPPINEVYSIRRTRRRCGHISISDHFSKWSNLGFFVEGEMDEVNIFVEAGGGTGSLDFTTASLRVN